MFGLSRDGRSEKYDERLWRSRERWSGGFRNWRLFVIIMAGKEGKYHHKNDDDQHGQPAAVGAGGR